MGRPLEGTRDVGLCVYTRLCLSIALVSLLALLPSQAFAERSKDGSGLFALSLEEALSIQVDASPERDLSEPGAYVLDRHELLRLVTLTRTGNHDSRKRGSASLPSAPGTTIPVLLNENYFGDFKSIKDVFRFARENKFARVELYVGDRARWWDQTSELVIKVITEPLPDDSAATRGSDAEEAS